MMGRAKIAEYSETIRYHITNIYIYAHYLSLLAIARLTIRHCYMPSPLNTPLHCLEMMAAITEELERNTPPPLRHMAIRDATTALRHIKEKQWP